MNVCKAGCVLALCAGVAVLTAAPSSARAQDRGQQDQQAKPSQSHAQKPQPSRAARPQHARPTARPQQSHTTARPQQQTHTATRPQQTHAARPQQNHTAPPQAARPSNNTRPVNQPGRPGNNGRPTTQPNRPGQGRPQGQPNRAPQGRPNYQFRSQDTSRLRQYYQGGFGRIDRRHRPRFYRGGYIPRTYWGDIQPVPVSLLGYLPAVPPGYALGYYDGYVVVYDPTTYLIVSVLNILQ